MFCVCRDFAPGPRLYTSPHCLMTLKSLGHCQRHWSCGYDIIPIINILIKVIRLVIWGNGMIEGSVLIDAGRERVQNIKEHLFISLPCSQKKNTYHQNESNVIRLIICFCHGSIRPIVWIKRLQYASGDTGRVVKLSACRCGARVFVPHFGNGSFCLSSFF